MKTQNRYNSILAGLFFLATVAGFAQQETKTFQLSLVYPVGTNGQNSGEIINDFSLNLFAGYSGGVNKLEIGGFYNITKGYVKGVQLGGFGNGVGGKVDGVQIAGFSNINKGNVDGVQLAGFLNKSKGSVSGAQVAGFSNLSDFNTGIQLAGFTNHSKGSSGMQLAGFSNISGDVKGAQAAGAINVARRLDGAQVGIINIADSISSGAQVGLINISKKNGFISLGLESDDFMPVRLAFRSGMDYFYTVLVAGAHPDEEYWSVGAGFGSRLFLSDTRKVFVNPEARWEYINAGSISDSDFSHLTKLNINFGYQLQKHLYLTAGPSVNYYVTDDLDVNGQPNIELTSNQTINRLNNNKRHQLWVGYNVGVGFKF